jgi:L-amino acid N-acyltransferase YncA
MPMELREMTPDDWPAVREIYRQGIEAGDATFENEAPDWASGHASRHASCRLVAESGGAVVGFACVSPTSKRAVYAGVGEVMVYVADGSRGEGLGGLLMTALVEATEAEGFWMLQAGIFPENIASIRAHERVESRVVGTREHIARFHDGRWRDTVIMERRSAVTGLD